MTDSVDDLIESFEREAAAQDGADTGPAIGIIMGSDTDLGVMAGAHDALTELGFVEMTADMNESANTYGFESYVISAHRTPDLLYSYASTAADRGIDVIIAGAGGKSADLPNMTASIAYPLPVIGVPIQEKSVDSVIGMPTGAPMTAVDAGKSFNAALSAVQILSRSDPELVTQLEEFHANLRESVGVVSHELNAIGTPAYLSQVDE